MTAIKRFIIIFAAGAALFCGCPQSYNIEPFDVRADGSEDLGSPIDEAYDGEVDDEDLEDADAELSDDAPCSIVPLALEPTASCGAYETLLDDVCIASSGGHASLRFVTNASCKAEVVCQESIASPRMFWEKERDFTRDHHVVVRDLPQDWTLLCDLFCWCPFADDLEILRTVDVYVPRDFGLVITEVFINPNGPEPDQEFVEIMNTARTALDIGGWRLADSPPPACEGPEDCAAILEGYGDVIPDDTVIGPAEPVLLVSSKFNRADPFDAMPPEDCTLISLDASLADRGLRNTGGEPVYVVDPGGNVAALYPNALGAPDQGVSIERVNVVYPDGDILNWTANPDAASSPCTY